jgi:hypothetical protein
MDEWLLQLDHSFKKIHSQKGRLSLPDEFAHPALAGT